jgi:hypothetical protein
MNEILQNELDRSISPRKNEDRVADCAGTSGNAARFRIAPALQPTGHL